MLDNYKKFTGLSLFNRDLLSENNKCSCFYCIKHFETSDIKNWIDKGKTALCPKCNQHYLLPGEIDVDILKNANYYWFDE